MSKAGPSIGSAEQLKAQGNALYAQKKYHAAYDKFSEAIKADRKNAILWSNRAASSLAMKDYLNAAADAHKAVQIDPKYAKAWSRLATAFQRLANWEKSINAWKNAIDSLPTEGLSDQDAVLLAQFKAGLKETEEASTRGGSQQARLEHGMTLKDAPWQRALNMENDVTGKTSSAWVIMNAFRDFQYGLEALNSQTERRIGDQVIVQGSWGALSDLTNAILRDTRVFHVKDRDFFDKYNAMVGGETEATGAWKTGGSKQVMNEAPKRLKRSGWEELRMTLATTVRAWVMADFFKNTIEGTPSHEFYRNAIEVLEWGRRTWRDVPRDKRGPIFELTFIRGVKRLYLKAVMSEYAQDNNNASLSLEEIAELARELIDDVQSNPFDVRTAQVTIDNGFWQSFWPYAKGDAHAVLGWYYMQLAKLEEDPKARQKHYIEAFQQYNEASNCFATDDEYRPYYLKIALEGMCWAGIPLRATLALCKRIRAYLPGVKKIWEHSQFSPQLNRHMEEVVIFETDYLDRIERGELTMEDVAGLEGITPIITDVPIKVTKA